LRGIESPKLKTVNPFEKHAAVLSRDALNNLIFNKIITLQNVNIERYGRIIADIYLDDTHVNQWMLDHHYVDKYTGGKQ
jgi:endonuclease YncB( thermonuclease family)